MILVAGTSHYKINGPEWGLTLSLIGRESSPAMLPAEVIRPLGDRGTMEAELIYSLRRRRRIRRRLKSIMNRTTLNKESNRRLKIWFENQGITRCELCGTDNWLSFAHRKKRRHYKTLEELSNPHEVLLLCVPCHSELEFDVAKTREVFKDLRDEVHF